MKKQKIGLLPVAALVIGSQIGVGVFMLPATLADLGTYSLFGWGISGLGAILMAIIFGKLCTKIPKAGGPHVYAGAAFGDTASFFTGWLYWVVSWTSNIAVIIAAISYLSPIIGCCNKMTNLALEVGIFTFLTLVNLRGTHVAGIFEVFLTIFKCIPLFVIPLIALYYFDAGNLEPMNPNNLELSTIIKRATLLTCWGFIGLESATANASIIDKPDKVVPIAVTYGTICVALIYCLNSVAIMGVIPNNVLMNSGAPYVDATNRIFGGGGWDIGVALIASLACIGTLNAWVLTGGQIAYGVAKDGLFPKSFAKLNRYNAPYYGLMVAYAGTLPLLALSVSDNLVEQINVVIDAAVTGFLLIYMICMLAFIKLYGRQYKLYNLVAIAGFVFCLWVILDSTQLNVIICSIIVLSGLPVYWYQQKGK